MNPTENGSAPLPGLRLRFFGAFEADRGGTPLPRTRTRKEVWLLALLTLRHGQAVDRSWLAGTLWPDSSDTHALAYLRSSLYDLRRILGPDASRLSAPAARSVSLDLTGADVDLLEFGRLIERADTASLEEAVALYPGPLLEGCTGEWVFPERERCRGAYLQALETLAAAALMSDDPDGASSRLRAVILADPLRESAHRALMEALAANGACAAAAQVYRDLRSLLHAELNATPAAETTALYEQLRATARAAGEFGNGTRALSLPTTVRGNLSLPLTPLIGRVQEVQAVSARLAAARLVTLTGTGGVGKTRLAIQVAEEAAEQYADGVWFVELAPLTDPDLLPQAAAAALGLRGEGSRPPVETLLAELRPKSLLLVLDNCEHLLDAAARLADQVLARCPQVRVLATSRERLRLGGEVAWRVPSLAVPSESDLHRAEQSQANAVPEATCTSNLLNFDAVRLFVERATDAAPGFRPGGEQLAAIGRICGRLDGVPLAIELAAARVGVIGVAQILARIDDRFHLLTGGSRTALPRQQTLRATLDWSYDLLSESERILFRRLSVFAGGWTLEAAEAVADDGLRTADWGPEGPDDPPPAVRRPQSEHPPAAIRSAEVLDLLGQLVGKSVVLMDEHHPAGGHAPRYRLLETLREYGQGRLLESGEGETVRRRHLGYFLGLAEECEAKRYGADEVVWLERLEVEHDNLRAALAWAVAVEETGPGLRLGGALWRFWSTRGYAGEGRRQLARLLTLAGSPARATSTRAMDGWRARALLGAGSLSLEVGDAEAARSLCEESLGLWLTLGDMGGVADSLAALGITEQSQGGYVAARSLFAQCLSLQRELGDRWGIANSLNRLGRLSYLQGDYDLARELVEAALAIRRELGDQRGIAGSLSLLGSIARHHDEYEAASLLYEESLAIHRGLGDKVSIGYLLNALGELLRLQGDYARATELLEESLAICEAIDEPATAANTRQDLGHIALDQGEHGRAGALFEECLAVYRKLSDLRGIAWAQADLGTVALRQGEWRAAARHYRESLASRRDLNDRRGTAECLEGLAALANAMGQAGRAARLFGAAEGLREAICASGGPSEQEANRPSVSRAREMLPEEAFAAAWGEGGAMSLEQAIAYALEEAVDA